MKTLGNKNQFLLSNIVALCSIVALASIISSLSANPIEKLTDQWYVGGSFGVSDMDPDGGNTWKVEEGKDLSKKIYVGTDVSRQFGLEAFWADFGDAEMKGKNGDTGKVHYKAVGANIIYNSPYRFAGVRPLGKLGVAKFNNEDKGAVSSMQNNKLTVFGGIGAEFDLSKNLKIRGEYEYFDKDISNLSIGLNWSPKYRDHSFISAQNRIIQPPVVTKKPDNIINVYVPPQRVVKQRPIVVVKQPKPIVVYKPVPRPRPVKRPVARTPPQYKVIHKTLLGGSHFDSGSAQLTPDGKNALNKLAQDLRNQIIKSIKIVGHTDSVGSAQSNLSLSYSRANAVASFLASRGVNRQLMNTTQGMGGVKPCCR